MNAKDHAKAEHEKREIFHLHRSRRYGDRSAALDKLAKHFTETGDEDAASLISELADIDKSMSGVENDEADRNRQMASQVDAMEIAQPYMVRKAAGVTDDLDKLVPDGVRSVIPAPPTVGETIYGADLTMVPRKGHRQRRKSRTCRWSSSTWSKFPTTNKFQPQGR
jgi:hypothetical protein